MLRPVVSLAHAGFSGYQLLGRGDVRPEGRKMNANGLGADMDRMPFEHLVGVLQGWIGKSKVERLGGLWVNSKLE
jgi:hypothetical protein